MQPCAPADDGAQVEQLIGIVFDVAEAEPERPTGHIVIVAEAAAGRAGGRQLVAPLPMLENRYVPNIATLSRNPRRVASPTSKSWTSSNCRG